ncbi:unnamed protein product [Rhizophagus irregularis]|nr:unnamed protein product [Rhizophagus irregularis]
MTSTYIWILKCLMEATDKTIPKAFWTDSESCLINAAFHVFPTTPYFYCLFHIWQNIIKHLKNKLDKAFPSFIGLNRQFNAGIQSTQSVESFNVDLKAQQTTVELPHLALQFFSNIDAILNHFLMPLVLSWQRFQISQSLTYEGQLVLSFDNVLESDTIDNYFIEDVVDEPQIILQSFLNGIDSINIIEIWRIRRVGRLSKCENLVILLDDGSHLCTCIESVTKEGNIENLPILTAIESNDNSSSSSSYQINFTLQNIRHFQGLDDNKSIHQQNTSQRNRFGIAFSINLYIASKRKRSMEVGNDDNLEEINGIERAAQNANIISLQKDLIDQITDPNVTKFRELLLKEN